ncbi:MAG TPA: hypothetical protein VGM88_32340 [Kofleriaceae bacterium]|jgi:hypothetical protein
MRILALVLPIIALPIMAHGAVCPTGNPDVADCQQKTLHEIGAEPATETNPQDQAMVAYRPAHPAASPKLVVIIHGHTGPATVAFSDFQQLVASLGYYSISLDADFAGNEPATPQDTCASNQTASTCDNGPETVCGCYSGCYGEFNALINGGGTYWDAGLPLAVATDSHTGVSRYIDVKSRLASYLTWLGARNSGWNTFLSGGAVAWSNVIGAGVSRGSGLLGYLAKNHSMSRVLFFSGPVDWLGTDGTYEKPGAGMKATTYGWGNAHNYAACTATAGAPSWVTDNHFGSNTQTPWQTQVLYSFDSTMDVHWDRAETVGGHDGSKLNLTDLAMTTLHDAGQPDQFLDVGTATGVPSVFHGYHALTSSKVCTGALPDGGHVETLSDSTSCADTSSRAFRHAVWTYMLTN